MDDIAEKRVYADRTGAAQLVVAAAPGLVTVAVSDGRVGEFGVAKECSPADLAAAARPDAGDQFPLAVATDRDVLLTESAETDALERTGFGPATAVTVHEGRPMAADPAGELATYRDSGWESIGELPGPATALVGDLIGTAEGVFRLVDGGLRPAGLADVTDVARAAGMPLVATADGLYELGNGWLDVLEGAFDLVAATPDGRAHAAGPAGCFTRENGAWAPCELPGESAVAAVAYGPRTFVLTAAGDLYVEKETGWARTPLGIDGIVGAVLL
ncbi:MAG: hypothetical protein ABEH59_10020 [Halobacteriales archaeon]